jgi:hypothetical protein
VVRDLADEAAQEHGHRRRERQVHADGCQRSEAEQLDEDGDRHAEQDQVPGQPVRQEAVDHDGHELRLRGLESSGADAVLAQPARLAVRLVDEVDAFGLALRQFVAAELT